MSSFDTLALVIVGGVIFFLYRSHKRKVNYESVCEVTQVLRDLAYRAGADLCGKVHRYEVMADAIREAQAAVFAKRTFDRDYTSHIQQQLLSSFAPELLESIGIFRGTEKFSRCYSGLTALAGDFERIQPSKTQW